MFPCNSLSLMLTAGRSNHWARFPLEVWRAYFEIRKDICEHYALFFVFNMVNFLHFILGPSPQPSRSASISGLDGGKVMRALVPHPPSANSTLLPFSRGETITLLVKEPRNGWLFGCSDSSGRWENFHTLSTLIQIRMNTAFSFQNVLSTLAFSSFSKSFHWNVIKC